MSAIKSSGFAVVTGLTFKSQALLGAAKIFSKLGGAPKRLQIDGEGNLNTSLALNYFEGARECEVITTAAGSHFRNGKVERLHQTLKGCVRAMLLQSGLSVRFWYHALQHAVGSRLHRQVEKRHELRHVAMRRDQVVIHVDRMRRRVADALDPVDLGNAPDQFCEVRAAAARIAMVRIDVLTEQGDLANASHC